MGPKVFPGRYTAEIEGDHLAPVVWRDRLYLFWVTFIEKPKQTGGEARTIERMTALLIQLNTRYHWNGVAGFKLLHQSPPSAT